MNEKHNSQDRKITPLFSLQKADEWSDDEALLLHLDESDTQDSKRAFLNQCALSDPSMKQWNDLVRVVEAGKKMPVHEADPSIRSRILDAAFQEAQGQDSSSHASSRLRGFYGWKWAWAALFLAFLWSGYQEVHWTSPALTSQDSLDYELLSLEEELNQLQEELGLGWNSSSDGSA